MSLRSNQTDQMAKRLKQDLTLLLPTAVLNSDVDANGNPVLHVNNGSADYALIRLNRRSFNGYNITLELDSTAGQGYPEHECWLACFDNLAIETVAMLVKACTGIGASELEFVKLDHTSATLDQPTSFNSANITVSIPNDARVGSVGA